VYVAVKRIHPSLISDRQVYVLFEREAEIAGRFCHKNVVAMIERGTDSPYIAMELVRGLDLATLVSRARVRSRNIPVDLAAFIARELLRGLAHVHGWGVIHCDVSPRNVLLSFDGDVKLTDFGVARYTRDVTDVQRKRRRTFMKVGYVAPEQLHGEPWTRASDLWAVGVLIHELLSGQRLFRADTVADTLYRVDQLAIEAPSMFNPAVPRGLDELVMSMLERDRTRRLASATAAAEQLSLFVPPSNGPARLARLVTELSTIPEDTKDAEPTVRIAA
jgi:serine/threonine protein kinase